MPAPQDQSLATSQTYLTLNHIRKFRVLVVASLWAWEILNQIRWKRDPYNFVKQLSTSHIFQDHVNLAFASQDLQFFWQQIEKKISISLHTTNCLSYTHKGHFNYWLKLVKQSAIHAMQTDGSGDQNLLRNSLQITIHFHSPPTQSKRSPELIKIKIKLWVRIDAT